jgi:hypothetical protein
MMVGCCDGITLLHDCLATIERLREEAAALGDIPCWRVDRYWKSRSSAGLRACGAASQDACWLYGWLFKYELYRASTAPLEAHPNRLCVLIAGYIFNCELYRASPPRGVGENANLPARASNGSGLGDLGALAGTRGQGGRLADGLSPALLSSGDCSLLPVRTCPN